MSNPINYLPKGFSAAITPSDTSDIDIRWNHGVLAEGTGNLNIEYEDGSTHLWVITSLPWFIYGKIKKVKDTGTTVAAGKLFSFRVGI